MSSCFTNSSCTLLLVTFSVQHQVNKQPIEWYTIIPEILQHKV